MQDLVAIAETRLPERNDNERIVKELAWKMVEKGVAVWNTDWLLTIRK